MQVLRKFVADKERVGTFYVMRGADKEKVEQNGHPIEGIHLVKYGVHLENIIFMSGEGWCMFQLLFCCLEECWE